MGKRMSFQCSECYRARPNDGVLVASGEHIQERTDLYQVIFLTPLEELSAKSRLPPRCVKRCWDADREMGLIVSQTLLSHFRGLRYRRVRVITRHHATAQLALRLRRCTKVVSSVATESVAHPANWGYFQTTEYFINSHFRLLLTTFLHAMLYARRWRLDRSTSGRV